MTGPATEERLQQELDRFNDYVEIHDLPAIYHHWSHHHLLPKLEACGYASFNAFFVDNLRDQCHGARDRVHTMVSLGAGNCDFEIQLLADCLEQGIDNLRVHCVELNPQMVERGRALARERGLAERCSFEVTDLDHWRPNEPLSICLANHSLHHLVALESLFDHVRTALGADGLFLVNDMIGRNGHMRWPEALDLIETIWLTMPKRYKYNHQLGRDEPTFQNWDCSTEGNEGIRAQDILPLLMERFHFETFISFANLIDIFIDRSFGHNFKLDHPDDVAFIDGVATIDEAKIGSGEIKPTHLLATLRTRPVAAPRHYQHWTPEFCVRWPDPPTPESGA